ncbi:hypothetical protein [Methanimicrococcus hongohii]|uniref:hypothetical protein n=1 Tax=Methanimicrococcus hongohii TaxID=3028295 RepID=UPI002931E556|nr:hypothetical protein [Methanimicrococcus sp. Hf6]
MFLFSSSKAFSCNCLLLLPVPAKPVNLQLSFSVSVCESGLHFCLHLLILIVIRSHSRTCRRHLTVSVCRRCLTVSVCRRCLTVSVCCCYLAVSVCCCLTVSVCCCRQTPQLPVAARAASFFKYSNENALRFSKIQLKYWNHLYSATRCKTFTITIIMPLITNITAKANLKIPLSKYFIAIKAISTKAMNNKLNITNLVW